MSERLAPTSRPRLVRPVGRPTRVRRRAGRLAAKALLGCERTVRVLRGADGKGEIRRIQIILAGDSDQGK